MREDNCEHLYGAAYCDRCGKYTGEVCEFCGAWYDGGDYMDSQVEIWCQCTVEEMEEFRLAMMHMPEEEE